MPDIKIELTAAQSVQIYQRIAGMKHGDKTFKGPRQKFMRSITNAWPELEAEGARTKEEEALLNLAPARSVPFTSEQQKAVSEGLLSIMENPNTHDAVITAIFKEAKMLRLKTRLESAFFSEGCGPMEGALDGEDDSIDDEIEINQGQRELEAK